mgnify:CR=1 FL=1
MDWVISKIVSGLVFVLMWAGLMLVTILGAFAVAKLFRIQLFPSSGRKANEGENDDLASKSEATRHRSFSKQSRWKQALFLAAGPSANLLFPFVVYFLLIYGDNQVLSNRIGYAKIDAPAWKAGIRPGDELISINGEPISRWV